MRHMKRGSSSILASMVLVIAMGWANSVSAYVITTDEANFRSQYINPTESILFNSLKDGTTFTEVNGVNPYWASISIGGELIITENGWSDTYFIRSAFTGNPNNNNYFSATIWDGSSITPSWNFSAPFLSIYTNSDATPIALNTTIGFLGVIPDSPIDSHFVITSVLGPTVRVLGLEAGFSQVPILSTAWLFAIGLFAVIGVRRRKGFALRL
jgi:hypothetical protein